MRIAFNFNRNKELNVCVTRYFIVKYADADHKDYGNACVVIYVTSGYWSGTKQFKVKGKLNPGGEFIPKKYLFGR